MEIQSAFSSGLQGIETANENASQAAHNIATHALEHTPSAEKISNVAPSNVTSANTKKQTPLTQSLIDLTVAEHQSKQSVNVIQSADEVVGTLLDIRT